MNFNFKFKSTCTNFTNKLLGSVQNIASPWVWFPFIYLCKIEFLFGDLGINLYLNTVVKLVTFSFRRRVFNIQFDLCNSSVVPSALICHRHWILSHGWAKRNFSFYCDPYVSFLPTSHFFFSFLVYQKKKRKPMIWMPTSN